MAIVLTVCLIVFGIIIIGCAINSKHTELVKNISPKYGAIKEQINRVSFYKVDEVFNYRKSHPSKASYDKTDIDSVCLAILYEDLERFSNVFFMVQENERLLKELLERITCIRKSGMSIKFYQQYRFFEKIEKNQCDRLIPKPTTTIFFNITHSYTSPQGRNHYEESRRYDFNQLRSMLSQAKHIDQMREIAENTKEYQRKLMTDSLRYDVMKRDGFRCVLCGATASDGVKLHVDHIFPVSKGGKTEMSNLRTLCENCNLDKRAKYDPTGVN